MKQAILGILEENYDFEQSSGSLSFSCESIELSFLKSDKREGSFQLVSNLGNHVQGYVFSDSFRMQCLTKCFKGNTADINYCFDSTGMEPGDRVEGEIHIISSFGEYSIPFTAVMEQEFLFSSMGPIKNLFHFANLAQTNWQEAVNLFYSKRFSDILKGNEEKYRSLYRGLSHCNGSQKNVEEFLIAVKKKASVTFQPDVKEVVIKQLKEDILREITLTRSGWGYTSVKVQVVGEFLSLDKNCFSDDDFLGNTLKIPFYIHKDSIYRGKNHGKIIISDERENLEICVTVENDHKNMEESDLFWQQRLIGKLTKLYIDFRCARIEASAWTRESMRIVEQISGKEDKNIVARLYQVQLLLATKRLSEAKWIMEQVTKLMEEQAFSSQVEAYFLYLTALCNKEDMAYIDKVTHKVRKMYHKESENWRLAWVLLYLQDDYMKNPGRKWDFLADQYDQGSFSPVLYVEAMPLLKENPSLLMKLDKYELQLLHFIIRNDKMTPALADRILFLCSREREYSEVLFRILIKCYELYPNKELLQGICTFIMKGNCIGENYFPWYALAVENELRLTRLYDYYMLSINLNYQGELPKMVMMYFAYQSNLPYERSAFLYANVIRYKNKYPEIAAAYAEHIDEFIREQLSKGRVSDSLCYLYQHVIGGYMLDQKLCMNLAPQLFMHRVTVHLDNIRSIVVIHNKVVEEKSVPVIDHVAYIPIYSKEYQLFLETASGDRRAAEEGYTVETIPYSSDIVQEVLSKTKDRIGVLLYLCEGKRDYLDITEDNVYLFARLLRTEHITPEYQKEILVSLVQYYFDNDCIHELDELLLDTNPAVLEHEERAEFLRILVARGMYDIAFTWVNTFGPESAKDKTLLRLCSRLLVRRDFEEDSALIEASAYAFRHGKYDPNILAYLVSYFSGTTKELKSLWEAAESFGVDNYVLLERLLIQMLYTGAFIGDRMQLYDAYVKNSGNVMVEKAFLTKCAYEFFVKETPTDEVVFKRIAQLMDLDEDMNRVCRLAYVKYMSEQDSAVWEADKIRTIIGKELKNQYYFPFFSTFKDLVLDISFMLDRSFIEYRGSAHSRVVLHYVLEKKDGADEYSKEEMKNMYGGIFVKGFVLFYAETIQYYITEENGNCEQLTQSSMLQRPDTSQKHDNSRFDILNDMLISREMQDYETCEQLMKEYAENKYTVARVFNEI